MAAINNRGQIVGWAAGADGVDRGLFADVRTGTVKHVALQSESRVHSINNSGIAVGTFKASLLGDHSLYLERQHRYCRGP